MTGNDVIYEALLLHGIIYAGQAVPTAMSSTAQTTTNNLLAEWNAQGLAIFSIVRGTYSLTGGQADYGIGPDSPSPFTVARPEKIEAWAVFDSSGASMGGKPVDAGTFVARAEDRSLLSNRIEMLNYDAAYPDGTIHLYPKPIAGCTLELWVWEQLSAISDFTQTLSFPPGYLKAIVYNLSVELAARFGRPVDPSVQATANETKATLGATNISEMTRIPPEDRPQPPQQQQQA